VGDVKRDIEEQAGIVREEAKFLGINFPHVAVKVIGER
jgi:hypothetical protein